MINHALNIVINELNKHLDTEYNPIPNNNPQVSIGNIAEGFVNSGLNREMLYFSLVNIKEEKALKNLPNFVRNNTKQTAVYENPPIFLNCQILMAATHTNYSNALLLLSRVIRYFQFKNVFTQESVMPESVINGAPSNALDSLESFKLIFDLYSPTMEEVNHLWGTLGGKQYPFVIYMLRMLELKFKAVRNESNLISQIVSDIHHKNSAVN
jgi:Pvc16 N-terminal domain